MALTFPLTLGHQVTAAQVKAQLVSIVNFHQAHVGPLMSRKY